mmetsp:Transcript_28913/g.68204  ORF Transcript_28913/g.68204 Transcript_28913/m.68204 type:complete len:332 (-) Transcript_28913:7-1002(-)
MLQLAERGHSVENPSCVPVCEQAPSQPRSPLDLGMALLGREGVLGEVSSLLPVCCHVVQALGCWVVLEARRDLHAQLPHGASLSLVHRPRAWAGLVAKGKNGVRSVLGLHGCVPLLRHQVLSHSGNALRADEVGKDVALEALHRAYSVQPHEGSLGCSVVPLAKAAVEGRHAADEDQPAVLLLGHVRPGRLHHAEAARGVRVQDFLELLDRHLLERPVRQLAGVADDHVHSAELPDATLDRLLPLLGHVGVVSHGGAAEVSDLRRHLVRLLRSAVVDHDLRPTPREQEGILPAEAPACASDHRRLPIEAHSHWTLRSGCRLEMGSMPSGCA